LQLVADVEVVRSCAEAGFGQRGRGVQERAGGVQDQVHAVQRGCQRGLVVQGCCPVPQAELLGQRGDGRRAAAREYRPVTALSGVPRDQRAGVAGGAVDHPRAGLARGACSIAVVGDVVWHS
jgi:hypothetical protein